MARCYLPLPSGGNEETASDAGSDRGNETLENSTDAPLVNGTAESKDGSVADKVSIVFVILKLLFLYFVNTVCETVLQCELIKIS